MDTFIHYKKGIVNKSIIGAIPFAIACLVTNNISWCIALSFGFCIGLVNFHLLSCDIISAVGLPQKRFTSLLISKYFLRYCLITLSMVCAITHRLSIPLFIVGFFFVQGVIFIDTFLIQSRTA